MRLGEGLGGAGAAGVWKQFGNRLDGTILCELLVQYRKLKLFGQFDFFIPDTLITLL